MKSNFCFTSPTHLSNENWIIISWLHLLQCQTWKDYSFLGSKIQSILLHISYWMCTHKIKTCLLLGRKTLTNLDRVFKQRHHYVNKGPYSQSYSFSSSHIRMWELDHKEGWALKIDAFELWCWRTLLTVPWIARRAN